MGGNNLMWIPNKVFSLFEISKDVVADLKEEVSALRAERDALKLQLATTQIQFDWLRVKVNGMEIERAQLLEKAYNIKVPVPEIVRTTGKTPSFNSALFEDVGDEVAKELGLPVYGTQ